MERHRFGQRAQEPGEGIDEFVNALRELASTCDFAAQLEECVRDQLVAGVAALHLMESFLYEGSALTLKKALAMARSYEQVRRGAKLATTAPLAQEVLQRHQSRGKCTEKFQGTVQCYGCGAANHMANDVCCKAHNKMCAKCGRNVKKRVKTCWWIQVPLLLSLMQSCTRNILQGTPFYRQMSP